MLSPWSSASNTARSYLPVPQEVSSSYRGLNPHQSGPKPLWRRWKDGEFSFVPDQSEFVQRWDVVLISALVCTAAMVPLEVSLFKKTPHDWYIAGKMIDCVFCCDIILNFNLAYELKFTRSRRPYEVRPLYIARRYLSFPFSDNMSAGWFWPDIATVIPWESIPAVSLNMTTLRLLRVLRLIRMFRLVRVVKLLRNWHTRMGLSYALLKNVTCFLTTLAIVHWLSCLWAHLGLHPEYYASDGQSTWLVNHIARLRGRFEEPIDVEHLEAMPIQEVYCYSLYLCTVVLTTVGFGDIVPVNGVEVFTMVFTIFLTGITWAWVVANVVNVITNIDSFGNVFNGVMDDINGLMSSNGLRTSLKRRIRKHLHESYYVQKRRHANDALKWLSEGLKGELAVQCGVDIICQRVWYFKGLPQVVVIEIADEFVRHLFSPNETIAQRDSASVIVRGVCIKNSKLLTRDCVFGEDMILKSTHLRENACPVTLSFLEVMSIHRDSLMDACTKYPDFNQRMRRAQIRLAVWRSFIYHAKKMKNSLGQQFGKHHTTWVSHMFSVTTEQLEELQLHAHRHLRPGFKEIFKEYDELHLGDRKTEIEPPDRNTERLLDAIKGLRHDMREQRDDIRLCLERVQNVDGRLRIIEGQVQDLSESVTSPKVNGNAGTQSTPVVQRKKSWIPGR